MGMTIFFGIIGYLIFCTIFTMCYEYATNKYIDYLIEL